MARCHTVKPRLALHMPKKISDITDYCHALYKAVVYIGKLGLHIFLPFLQANTKTSLVISCGALNINLYI